MKTYLLSLALLISSSSLFSSTVSAAPVVVDGSSYSVFLQGNGDQFLGVTNFDAAPATAIYNGLTLTLMESETLLADGRSRIVIDLSANGLLFPDAVEQALLGIGVDGDGLDLALPVTLEQAFIVFRNSAGAIVRMSENLADQVPRSNPWDGYFPEPDNVFADDVGGLGVTQVSFDFVVRAIGNEVPEPGSLLLASIGLLGLASARRKQAKNTAA